MGKESDDFCERMIFGGRGKESDISASPAVIDRYDGLHERA